MKTATKLFQKPLFALIAFCLFTSVAYSQSAAIVGPTINCQGNSLTLTVNITGLTGPFTYQWSNGATTPTVTISASAFLIVTVTGTNASGNQQSVTSAPRIFLFFPSPSASITPNGSTNLCVNPSVNLTANSTSFFTSYLWSTGQTSQTITVTTAGTYTVTVSNLFGCTGQAEQIVTAGATTPPKVNALGPVTFCKPGSVTLEADGGFTAYLWSTGETTQSITVTLTGSGGGPILDTVSVSYTVDPGTTCEAMSDIVVVRSIREPHLLPPYCPNFNLALSDSIKTDPVLSYNNIKPGYDFEFEETTNPGVTTTYFSTTRWCKLSNVTPPLQVGKYYNVRTRGVVDGVRYCYGSLCQIGITSLTPPISGASSVIRVYTDEDGEQIFVRDGLNFGIYPNPSSDVFTANLFTNDDSNIKASIQDLSGRIIAVYNIDPSMQQFTFGSELNAGIYLIEFSQGESLRQTAKIIKTN